MQSTVISFGIDHLELLQYFLASRAAFRKNCSEAALKSRQILARSIEHLRDRVGSMEGMTRFLSLLGRSK